MFYLVLRIVHGQWDDGYLYRDCITTEQLAKIALIVDYYQLHSHIDTLPIDVWIDVLNSHATPTIHDIYHHKEMMLWICILWMFKHEVIFQTAGSFAIGHYTGNPAAGLPIHNKVTGRLITR